ncbi:MAG TPA: hypothetical protein VFP11_15905, partial [Candidatus Angelobacter sp.]|nr:hypothetical protein [Candidatus Angelobacter sp.]
CPKDAVKGMGISSEIRHDVAAGKMIGELGLRTVSKFTDVQHKKSAQRNDQMSGSTRYKGCKFQRRTTGFGVNSGWTLHVAEFKVTAILPPKREVDLCAYWLLRMSLK